MNNVFSGYILNRPNTYKVIQGNSGDWNHLYTDSQQLESLCKKFSLSPTQNPLLAQLINVLEVLLNKLIVLIHHCQNLNDYLNGNPLQILPGSTQAAYIMLLSDKYFCQLQRAVALLETFLLAAQRTTRQQLLKLSSGIACHYSDSIRQCLIPGKLDFCPLSDVSVIW